jgi:hypothetical protein
MSHFHEHSFDDSDDSEDDIPPPSGFSQHRDPNAFRIIVIEDSSSEGVSEHLVHGEEIEEETDANLSNALDKKHALSSQSEPALAPHCEQDTEQSKEATKVTSVGEESNVDTPDQKPSINVDNESLVDDSLDDDSTCSTVDEEGRIKMAKRKPPMDESDAGSLDDSLEHDILEHDDKITVVQEGRIKTPMRQTPIDETDDDSLDNSLEHDDTSTVVQEGRIKTPRRKTSIDETNDYFLDNNLEHDDTSTVVQEGRIKTPKRKPTLDEDDEHSLSDSSLEHDDNSTVVQEDQIQTPRKVMMRKFIEALDDSSLGDDATLLVQGGHAAVQKQSSETEFLIDEDSEELIDIDGEALKSPVKYGMAKHNVSFGNDFENSAWALDAVTNEVFLSADRYAIPNAVWPKLRVPIELYNQLYNHQKAGVQWMASLHSNRIGGILGDGE